MLNPLFKKTRPGGRYTQRRSLAQEFYTRMSVLTSTIDKRQSLHRQLEESKQKVESLSKQIDALEGLASVGTAAAMIAHEINNLLTPVGSYATLALRNPEDKALAEKALKRTGDNCRRAAEVTEAILDITKSQDEQKQQENLAKLVEDVFLCLCRDFSKDGITVKKDISKNLTVYAVPVKLRQVIMNLVLNAREAMLDSRGGTLRISGEDCGDCVKIKIADTGCGMSKETVSRIFEPFFTTKSGNDNGLKRPGAGLGLALCRRIIEQHSGVISVESEPNTGSTFTITLPQR